MIGSAGRRHMPPTESYAADMLNAALAYARQGIPVFRLQPGTKVPFCGSRGFYDATTNFDTIRKWWRESPDANIGIPTGEFSGILTLDLDTYKPGAMTPEAIQRKLGPIPKTALVGTGSGGLQYRFRFTSELSKETLRKGIPENELGVGVCVKADGGYVVAPPSRTTGPYMVLEKRPLADPPAWLIEALREPQRLPRKRAGRTATAITMAVTPDTDGPPIPAGTRNDTLTRIAGRLHDGTRTLDELTAALLAVNEARCKPPLPERQVVKIAGSIHARTPCKATRRATAETIEALDEIEAEMWEREWPGVGGKSERDAFVALIVVAREVGELIPGGVRVSLSVRAWALEAGSSKRAMLDYSRAGERKPGVISRLKRRGLIRSDRTGQREGEAGAFVLVLPRAEFHHSST
jgi:hypothetical protein